MTDTPLFHFAADRLHTVLTLFADGRVVLAPGATIDEASQVFWAVVQKTQPPGYRFTMKSPVVDAAALKAVFMEGHDAGGNINASVTDPEDDWGCSKAKMLADSLVPHA